MTEHAAWPKPAIVALYPTRGGWRASCTCGWREDGKPHRSESASMSVADRHVRDAMAQECSDAGNE